MCGFVMSQQSHPGKRQTAKQVKGGTSCGGQHMVLMPGDCSCIDTAPSAGFLTMVAWSDAAVFLTLKINVNMQDTR